MTNETQNLARATISAFVVCCNEEKKIRRCLQSVAWCDEIVVVDSGSKDATLSICREFTDRIIERPWPGFVEQKRFALGQCRNEWVLNIDADEEVSEELAAEIQTLLAVDAKSPLPVHGYELLRVVRHLGRWWRKGGWHPEFRLRLCRRSKTSWAGEDPHERAVVEGPTKRLRHELKHYTYASLEDQVRSLNKLSSDAAKSLHRKGKTARISEIVFRPLVRFIKFYFLKKGFKEGTAGFIVAFLEAAYVMLKYAKLWEMTRGERAD